MVRKSWGESREVGEEMGKIVGRIVFFSSQQLLIHYFTVYKRCSWEEVTFVSSVSVSEIARKGWEI